MQLPPQTPEFQKLSESQRFFVELWHGMTHTSSLDSYRLRLHNGRTILNELRHEIELGVAQDDDLQKMAAEAQILAAEDIVFQSLAKNSLDSVERTLTPFVSEGKKAKPELPRLRFLLSDILEKLDEQYLSTACELLTDALKNDTAPFTDLRKVTGLLLTDLVARGWMLESLHGWARNLSGNLSVTVNKSFDERFEFMAQQFLRGEQTFDVVMRISGSPNIAQLGTFMGCRFSSKAPSLERPQREFAKYLKASPQVAFVSFLVESVEFKSACHVALEKFEKVLDRLRFNFATTPLSPDNRIFIIRNGDQKRRLERFQFPVPNPQFTFGLTEFRKQSRALDRLMARENFERNSEERLIAAARHYRLGQDAESYRDKLINWWFGLEYLTKVGGASIGEAVVKRCANMMSIRYLILLLLDLGDGIRAELESWPESVQKVAEVEGKERIVPEKLLLVLQDSGCIADLQAAFASRPWAGIRLGEMAGILSSSQSTLQFMEEHRQRIEWQLWRLYRTRCCLVHGSPLANRLMLLCGNLEFYLRETMVVSLKTLIRNEHIGSLGEVYQRATHCVDARAAKLKDRGTNPTSADAIFDGLVNTL